MKRYIQHELLKISHFATDRWHHPVHNHNHFEIVFVHYGKGIHQLNGVDYNYSGRTLFLLGPSDYHSFLIEEETQYTFLKFTNQYLGAAGGSTAELGWNHCIDELIVRTGRKNENILTNEYDAEAMDKLVHLIVREWKHNKNETGEMIFFLIQAALAIIKRNIYSSVVGVINSKPDEKITSLLHYIHSNIYNNENIQIEHLAEAFGYSKNYLGIFFKDQIGVSLRDYISKYKITLIENRLKYSSFSIKEISYEFGFTDLSHFNKFFRKHLGVTPSEFRKQLEKLTVGI